MSVFCTTWVDGKIDNINKLIEMNPDRIFAYILDTNFIIYARNYIEDKEMFRNENIQIYDEFIKTVDFLKDKDMIFYQFGCEESSRNKLQGKLNIKKYKYTVRCLNEILEKNFSDEIITDDFADEIIYDSKINAIKTNKMFGIKLMIAYASLMKAFIIKQFDNLSKEEKIYKYIDFLDKELNIMSPMEITFAYHYFGNRSNILKKVKKSDTLNQIMDKIYAAAIDLTLPTVSAQLSDYSDYNVVPIFVTFDKGIKLIFDSLILIEVGIWNKEIIPKYDFKVFYDSGWKDDDIMRISSNLKKITEKREREFNNGIKKSSTEIHFLNMCRKMEEELKSKKESESNKCILKS